MVKNYGLLTGSCGAAIAVPSTRLTAKICAMYTSTVHGIDLSFQCQTLNKNRTSNDTLADQFSLENIAIYHDGARVLLGV